MEQNQGPHSPNSEPAPQIITKVINPQGGFFKEFFSFFIIATVIAVPFRLFIAQPFIVSGASMDPTFYNKQYLIIDELSYEIGYPKRGDVVVFKYPLDTSKYFIKRVIGLPGERVSVNGNKVTIYNKENPNGFILSEPYVEFGSDKVSDKKLGADEYFVMGDNRKESLDSRYWGAVPKKDLTGRVFLRLFPVNKIGVLPGSTTY